MTDWTRNRNRSNRRREIIFAKRSKINAAPAKKCSSPENRDASISLCKHIANAKEFSIVFEHLDRSRHRNRSNRCRKIFSRKEAKSTPRRRKIVRGPKIAMRRFPSPDIEQTLCSYRSFLSASINRGIDIDRIDVEKPIWTAKEKSAARRQNMFGLCKS